MLSYLFLNLGIVLAKTTNKKSNHSKRTLEDDSDKVDDADDATDILDSCAELENGIARIFRGGLVGSWQGSPSKCIYCQ